jgi:uncharacterized protein YfaS (alpha-2-macroglobulin family)
MRFIEKPVSLLCILVAIFAMAIGCCCANVFADDSKIVSAGMHKAFKVLRADKVLSKSESSGLEGNVGGNIVINFSDVIDAKTLKQALEIEPEPPLIYPRVIGSHLELRGSFAPDTRYRFTLAKKISDTSGQTLKAPFSSTFRTGSLKPRIKAPEFITFNTSQHPVLQILVEGAPALTINVRAVEVQDWTNIDQRFHVTDGTVPQSEPKSVPVYGKNLATFTCQLKRGNPVVAADLQPYFKEKYGHLLITASILDKNKTKISHQTWVQRSDINLDAVAGSNLSVLATSAIDNKPLPGLTITLSDSKLRGTTDSTGKAQLNLPDSTNIKVLMVAENGLDKSLLTAINAEKLFRKPAIRQYLYAVSDRSPYRPGEKVTLIGLVRQRTMTANGMSELQLSCLKEIAYCLSSGSKTIAKGTCPVDMRGSFSINIDLPADCPTGEAYLQCNYRTKEKDYNDFNHFENFDQASINIEEFRRAEFSTRLSCEKEDWFRGEQIVIAGDSDYLNGGPLNERPVQWQIARSKHNFSPPGMWHYRFAGREYSGLERDEVDRQSVASKTDADGHTVLKIDTRVQRGARGDDVTRQCQSERLKIQCTTTDINRQQRSATKSVWVHPSDIFVGVDSAAEFRPGKTFAVNVIATNCKGELIKGSKASVHITETSACGVEKDNVQTVEMADGPARLMVTPAADTAKISIRAESSDSAGRLNFCQLKLKLADKKAHVRLPENARHLSVNIACPRKIYKAGETVTVAIHSTALAATGVIMVRSEKATELIPVNLVNGEATLQLPITTADYPGISVLAHLKDDDGATGMSETYINVPPLEKKLAITITPESATYQPKSQAQVAISVKDAQGVGVPATVALAVVDEAVLALSDHNWPNPSKSFFVHNPYMLDAHSSSHAPGLNMRVYNARITDHLFIDEKRIESLLQPESNELRRDFSPLAYFSDRIETDGRGMASVNFKVPDSLTRYRILAFASSGADKFGTAESSTKTDLPLAIKPSPPRFLNLQDQCELPVVIYNRSTNPLQLKVTLQSDSAHVKSNTQTVTLPAGGSNELRFLVKALKEGPTLFRCMATSGSLSDSTQFSLPTVKTAILKTSSTYGTIDSGDAEQTFTIPPHSLPGSGGLTVRLSSSASNQLDDCLQYLQNYQFDCSEQISSRLLAILAAQKVGLGKSKNFDSAKLEKQISADIGALCRRQNDNGSVALWPGADERSPFASVQVNKALLRASAGHKSIDQHNLDAAIQYLTNIDKHIPDNWDIASGNVLKAMALNTLHIAGKKMGAQAAALMSHDGKEISLETAALLMPVMASDGHAEKAQLLREMIAAKTAVTASTASLNYVLSEDLQYHLFASAIRADALVTEALIDDAAPAPGQDELIRKFVKGLLARQQNGVWQGTQENSMVFQALCKYFNKYENAPPDFTATTFLDGRPLAENKFDSTKASTEIKVPMSELSSPQSPNVPKTHAVQIKKNGPGRLYYEVAVASESALPERNAINQGFSISRNFEAINTPSDVSRDSQGTWHIKAGATIKVRLRFSAPGRRFHVAMVDPLVAGTDVINTRLKGAKQTAIEHDEPRSIAFEHENKRDQRIEGFKSNLDPGDYEYTYLIQTTTPGIFSAQGARIEEMYAPETFGLSEPADVIIE